MSSCQPLNLQGDPAEAAESPAGSKTLDHIHTFPSLPHQGESLGRACTKNADIWLILTGVPNIDFKRRAVLTDPPFLHLTCLSLFLAFFVT